MTLTIAAFAFAVTGCTNDPLAQQFRDGSEKNYVAGDGTITEITSKDRAAPVRFASTTQDGAPVSSATSAGHVLVVNFWYAGCAPCRAEAPDLEKSFQAFAPQGVQFLGVNVRDQADTARAFERNYGVSYPSVLDADSGNLQLAFSGAVAPNAVPTTLVLDEQGRVAARVLGRLPDVSVLSGLITRVLSEQGP